jgi:ribonuclease P protein component
LQRDADTPAESLPPPPDLRMPPELRLRAGARIREILAGGQRAAGERVLLVGLPNQLGHARLACVCGRRFDKRAVARNRWRRRIREIFRVRRAELEGNDPGWDWVAVALKREGTIAFARLGKDFLGAAARARKAKPGPPPGRARR